MHDVYVQFTKSFFQNLQREQVRQMPVGNPVIRSSHEGTPIFVPRVLLQVHHMRHCSEKRRPLRDVGRFPLLQAPLRTAHGCGPNAFERGPVYPGPPFSPGRSLSQRGVSVSSWNAPSLSRWSISASRTSATRRRSRRMVSVRPTRFWVYGTRRWPGS